MSLLLKELKINLKSLTYWISFAIILFFMIAQLGTELITVKEPQPGQDDYGMTPTDDPDIIMSQTYYQLAVEFATESYSSYPLGFQKSVQLSQEGNEQVAQILADATGKTTDELTTLIGKQPQITIVPSLSFEQFKKDMKVLRSLIGRGSHYEETKYLTSALEPRSYEQAQADFRQIVDEDHVTGAYARLVCDYGGIILALVPIFLGATIILRDRRAGASQVIFSKSVSSAKLIGTRFLSTVFLMFVPVLVVALFSSLQVSLIGNQIGAEINYLSIFIYVTGWLLPTIIAVVGLGFMMTELFGGIFSVLFQLVIWLLNVFLGVSSGTLVGAVGWNLIPRFNTIGDRAIFEEIFSQLVLNRIAWSLVGFCCGLATIIIVNFKRNGGELCGKIR